VELFWNQGSYFKTIELDSALNVALLRSAPNFDLFAAFSAEVASIESPIDEKELMCVPCAPAAQEVTDERTSRQSTPSISYARGRAVAATPGRTIACEQSERVAIPPMCRHAATMHA